MLKRSDLDMAMAANILAHEEAIEEMSKDGEGFLFGRSGTVGERLGKSIARAICVGTSYGLAKGIMLGHQLGERDSDEFPSGEAVRSIFGESSRDAESFAMKCMVASMSSDDLFKGAFEVLFEHGKETAKKGEDPISVSVEGVMGELGAMDDDDLLELLLPEGIDPSEVPESIRKSIADAVRNDRVRAIPLAAYSVSDLGQLMIDQADMERALDPVLDTFMGAFDADESVLQKSARELVRDEKAERAKEAERGEEKPEPQKTAEEATQDLLRKIEDMRKGKEGK